MPNFNAIHLSSSGEGDLREYNQPKLLELFYKSNKFAKVKKKRRNKNCEMTKKKSWLGASSKKTHDVKELEGIRLFEEGVTKSHYNHE